MIVVDLLVAMGCSDVSTLASHLFEKGGFIGRLEKFFKSWESSSTKKPLEVTWSPLKSLDNKFQFFQQFGGSCPGNLSRLSGMHEDFRKIWQLHPVSTYDFFSRPGSNAISYTSVAWSRDELLLVGWVGWWQRFPWAQEMKHQIFCFFPKNRTNISPLSNMMLGRWFMLHIFCWKGSPFPGDIRSFCGGRLEIVVGESETWDLGDIFDKSLKRPPPGGLFFFWRGGLYGNPVMWGWFRS